MKPDPRNEEQPAENRKEVTERRRHFRIVKLEERIAPGGGHGKGSNYCGYSHNFKHCR